MSALIAGIPELGALTAQSQYTSGGHYGAFESTLTHKHGSPPLKSGNSAFLTAGIIIADVVGAGILSMGSAVAKFGWLLGSLIILLMLLMNVHISLLIWRVRMGCQAEEAYTYADLVSAAFARAPTWQRTAMERTTVGTQQLFLFTILGLYALSIGRALGTMFYGELRVCLPILVCFGLLLFSPALLSARSLGHYRSLIVLNVLTIMGSALIPLFYMAHEGTARSRPPGSTMYAVEEMTVSGVLSGLDTMTFAFTSQFMLVEIMAEMKDPAEFPTAYYISAPFQGVMFFLAGVGTYFYVGSSVTGVLGENLPYGPTFRVSSACMLVHMLITYLIKGVVFCRWAQGMWSPKSLNDTTASGWTQWGLVVTFTTASCWLVSQLVPFFTQLIDLLGASLTPLACYLVPIAMYVRHVHDTESDHKVSSIGYAEAALLVFEALLSLVLMSFGTYYSFVVIAEHWQHRGMPFQCHCQGIWSTCDCSSTHAGMEYCLVEH